jgi:hypothetical protein
MDGACVLCRIHGGIRLGATDSRDELHSAFLLDFVEWSAMHVAAQRTQQRSGSRHGSKAIIAVIDRADSRYKASVDMRTHAICETVFWRTFSPLVSYQGNSTNPL